MKKVISVFLAVLLLASVGAISVSAAKVGDSGSFSALCYNVAGLPDISFITGDEARDVPGNQTSIGQFVTGKKYDIFAVQEDFGYHDTLVKALPDYKYQTAHHGGVPYGDGTNIYTRSFPMYNEAHIKWNSLYGVADDGADEFSQKGITYACIEIADGVLVDFYDIHADAYGDEGSLAARIDNFKQLRDLINSRKVDRPVIVTGDMNAYLFHDPSRLKEILVDGAGLKDAWVEIVNGGNYDNCDAYLESIGGWTDKWGVWDSVERFMYKDGAGVSLTCDSFEYLTVKNKNGQSCSDHAAAQATFSYTVTGKVPARGDLQTTDKGVLSRIREFFRRVTGFFKALFFGLQNLDKVRDYFSK